MSFISCNDIFTVKASVIYLSIELSVKKNSGVKYRAAEYCFPRVHYLSIMPKVEAKKLQATYSVLLWVFQSMVSRCTTNSEEKTLCSDAHWRWHVSENCILQQLNSGSALSSQLQQFVVTFTYMWTL